MNVHSQTVNTRLLRACWTRGNHRYRDQAVRAPAWCKSGQIDATRPDDDRWRNIWSTTDPTWPARRLCSQRERAIFRFEVFDSAMVASSCDGHADAGGPVQSNGNSSARRNFLAAQTGLLGAQFRGTVSIANSMFIRVIRTACSVSEGRP
jgi:hypothetical protein